MNRFMIGHFGKFDKDKQIRDFKDGFFGVEACSLESEKDIDSLISEARENNFNIAVHFPLRSSGLKLRDAQFMSKDLDFKKYTYEHMESELTYLSKIKPEYILFHYPKPVLLDCKVDWTNWRFADETEYYYDNEYTYEEFLSQSEELFKWLTEKSNIYNFTPVLEFDALNRYIYENNGLFGLLERYSKIRVCLDIARLHLQDKIDENFNAYEVTRRYAKYAEVIHLSNVRVKDNLQNNHYPALRGLKSDDGWADIKKYLSIITEENNEFKILFEHRSDLISDEELNDCYQWVSELIMREDIG